VSASIQVEGFTPRTRTPPALKWLLNERAALAGRRRRQQKALAKAEEAVAVAQAALDLALLKRQPCNEAMFETARKLEALDHTIALISPDVEPGAAGVVAAWSNRWGERGALTKFLLATLSAAGSSGLLMPTLVEQVEVQFGIKANGWAQRKQLRDIISSRLRVTARKYGLVECFPGYPNRSQPPLWRWKQNPSLEDLHVQVQLLEGDFGEYGTHSHAL